MVVLVSAYLGLSFSEAEEKLWGSVVETSMSMQAAKFFHGSSSSASSSLSLPSAMAPEPVFASVGGGEGREEGEGEDAPAEGVNGGMIIMSNLMQLIESICEQAERARINRRSCIDVAGHAQRFGKVLGKLQEESQDLLCEQVEVVMGDLQKTLIKAEGMILRYQTSARLPLFLRAHELAQEEKEVREEMKSCMDVLVGIFGSHVKDSGVLMEMRTLSEQLTRAMMTSYIGRETLELSHELASVLRAWEIPSDGSKRSSCEGLVGSEGVAAAVRMELLMRVGQHLGMTTEEMMEERDILLRERDQERHWKSRQEAQSKCTDHGDGGSKRNGGDELLLDRFAEALQSLSLTGNHHHHHRHGSASLMVATGGGGSSSSSASSCSSSGGAGGGSGGGHVAAASMSVIPQSCGLSALALGGGGLGTGYAVGQSDSTRRELEERVTCPICLRMMENPVTVRSGISYCRECIANWFSDGRRDCPLTRQTLFSQEVYPNFFLQSIIERLKSGRRGLNGVLGGGGGGGQNLSDPIAAGPLTRHPVIVPPRRQPSDPSPLRGLLIGGDGGLPSPTKGAFEGPSVLGVGAGQNPVRPPHFRTASAPVPYSPMLPPLSASSPPPAVTSLWLSASSSPSSVSAASSCGGGGARRGGSGPLVIGGGGNALHRERYSEELNVVTAEGRRRRHFSANAAVPVVGSGVQPQGVANHSRHKSVRTDMYCLSQWVEVAKAPPGAEWRAESARALRELASHKDNHVQLVREGAVEPLLSFLGPDSEMECMEHAVSALAFLAVDEEAQVTIERLGAEAALVNVASFGKSKPCQELAASALWSLSSSTTTPLTIDPNVVEALGELRWKGSTAAVKESAAHALVNLASRGFSEGVLKEKGLPFLTDLANDPPTPVCVETAIDAIWKLSSLEDNKKHLCELGAVEMLLRICAYQVGLGSSAPIAVLEKAVHTLWNISFTAEGKDKIVANRNGVGWMVEIAGGDCSPRAREAAAGVLWNLATVNESLRQEIRAKDGVKVLLGLVKAGQTEGCKESSLGCLLNLALDEEGRIGILDAKGVSILCEWLAAGIATNTLRPRSRANIIRALGYLAYNEMASLRVWLAGGTHLVIRVLKDRGMELECREVAVMTLGLLAKDNKNRSVVIKEGALVAAVELGQSALAGGVSSEHLSPDGGELLAAHVARLLATVAMAKKKSYNRAVVKANGVPFLVGMLKSEGSLVVGIVQALRALCHLASQDSGFYRVVRQGEGGVVWIAACLCKCAAMMTGARRGAGGVIDEDAENQMMQVTEVISLGAELLWRLANDVEIRIAVGREQRLLLVMVGTAIGDGMGSSEENTDNMLTATWKARLASVRLLAKLAQDSEVNAQAIARAGGGAGAMAVAGDAVAIITSGKSLKPLCTHGSLAGVEDATATNGYLVAVQDIVAGIENALMLVNALLASGNRVVEEQILTESSLATLRLIVGLGNGSGSKIPIATNACLSNLTSRGPRCTQVLRAGGLSPSANLVTALSSKAAYGDAPSRPWWRPV